MTNILTITARELKSYFLSPIAYVIIALFAFFTGYIFTQIVAQTQQAQLNGDFQWMVVLALILAPALTMRLFAEENKQGTIELLMTSPVRDWEIVTGKFIAALFFFVGLLVPTLWHVILLTRFGNPDFGPIATGYLGVVLVGAAFVGVGLLTSSLTQNQFIAYMLGMITLLFLWVADAPANATGSAGALGDFFRFIALPGHFQDFFNGVIDTQHVLYFVSIAAITLFLTTRVVESRRWR
jgi:ABC-2 type transport system permease protein